MKGTIRYMYETNNSQLLSHLSFEELYEKYANDILRVAYIYLKDIQKAEDVCHDTFIRAINNPNSLINGKEKAWLLTVAVNCCKDILKSSWYKKTSFDELAIDNAVYDADIDHDHSDILEAIYKLSPKFKDVIILHYYQGFGVVEIADILHISTGTVSSRLSRARKKLEKILRDGFNEN